MTPNMQGIIMAIGKSSSVYEKNGPEAAFFKVHTISPLPFLISHSFHLLFHVYPFLGLLLVLSYSADRKIETQCSNYCSDNVTQQSNSNLTYYL